MKTSLKITLASFIIGLSVPAMGAVNGKLECNTETESCQLFYNTWSVAWVGKAKKKLPTFSSKLNRRFVKSSPACFEGKAVGDHVKVMRISATKGVKATKLTGFSDNRKGTADMQRLAASKVILKYCGSLLDAPFGRM